MAKLDAGKFTLKSMFSSKNAKAKLIGKVQSEICQLERDIENWEVVKRFLIVYIAEIAIPEYSAKKVAKYIQAMAGFSNDEILNSRAQKFCWQDFYGLIK